MNYTAIYQTKTLNTLIILIWFNNKGNHIRHIRKYKNHQSLKCPYNPYMAQ